MARAAILQQCARCSSGSSSARRQRPAEGSRTIIARATSSDALSSPLANEFASSSCSPSSSSSSPPSRGRGRSTARASQGPVYAAGILEAAEVEEQQGAGAPAALEDERSLLARSLARSLVSDEEQQQPRNGSHASASTSSASQQQQQPASPGRRRSVSARATVAAATETAAAAAAAAAAAVEGAPPAPPAPTKRRGVGRPPKKAATAADADPPNPPPLPRVKRAYRRRATAVVTSSTADPVPLAAGGAAGAEGAAAATAEAVSAAVSAPAPPATSPPKRAAPSASRARAVAARRRPRRAPASLSGTDEAADLALIRQLERKLRVGRDMVTSKRAAASATKAGERKAAEAAVVSSSAASEDATATFVSLGGGNGDDGDGDGAAAEALSSASAASPPSSESSPSSSDAPSSSASPSPPSPPLLAGGSHTSSSAPSGVLPSSSSSASSSSSGPSSNSGPGSGSSIAADPVTLLLKSLGHTGVLSRDAELRLSLIVRKGADAAAAADAEAARLGRAPSASEVAAALNLRGGAPHLELLLSNQRAAKDLMVQFNLRFVFHCAKRYQRLGLEMADLLAEGFVGLSRAVDKFEPARGHRFSTYASWWIRQRVIRSISNESRIVRLPVHIYEHVSRIRRAAREVNGVASAAGGGGGAAGDKAGSGADKTASAASAAAAAATAMGGVVVGAGGGEAPETQEQLHAAVAAATGLPVDKVESYLKAARGASSIDVVAPGEASKGDHNHDELSELLPCGGSFVAEARRDAAERGTVLASALDAVLASLPQRERNVLRMRYGLGGRRGRIMTLSDISAAYGVTTERIRQIEDSGLRRLREPGRAEGVATAAQMIGRPDEVEVGVVAGNRGEVVERGDDY